MLAQLALHATTPGLLLCLPLPGIPQLAHTFQVFDQQAVYVISVPLIFLAVGAFFWTALLNAYGRRPVLIGTTLATCATSLGAGFADTFGQMMAARILEGMFLSSGFVVPAAVVVDIFDHSQRGQKTGIWVQMV